MNITNLIGESREVLEEGYTAALDYMAAAWDKVFVIDYSDLFNERRR